MRAHTIARTPFAQSSVTVVRPLRCPRRFMASLDNKELAYSNAIQIIKALTMAGFVPNYSSGLYKSRDRTEPCIGVKVVSTLYHRFKDRWFLELLYPDLLSWNTYVHAVHAAVNDHLPHPTHRPSQSPCGACQLWPRQVVLELPSS